MKKYEVKGTLQIDPYGHKKLSPRMAEIPEGAVFVGSAVVWLEAICTDECYWLHEEKGSKKAFSLWCELGELGSEYRICTRIEPESETDPMAAARWLLSVLWYSRVSKVQAMTLDGFDRAGLLSQSCLDELAAAYHEAMSPPAEIPNGAQLDLGELFFESGELKYRGEHWQDQAHGKGTAFWKNGNVWCEGSFRNHEAHGFCRMYFPDGKLRHEGLFEDGYPKGPGREFYKDGQLWFEGIFAEQTMRYGYGMRKYVRGKLYNREGELIHDGDFVSDGHRSKPVRRKKRGRS